MPSLVSISEIDFPPRRPDAGHGMECKLKRILIEQRGQATAEYALVIVAAAAVAGTLILWATNSGAMAALFDAVVERVSRFI
jgi:Flp pilus assembly pilin Flp